MTSAWYYEKKHTEQSGFMISTEVSRIKINDLAQFFDKVNDQINFIRNFRKPAHDSNVEKTRFNQREIVCQI